MFIKFGGRQYGKSYKLLCEQINELYFKIELAKSLGISYKKEEQELNSLLKKLDGGNNRVKEKQNNTNRKTTNKKDENNPWRLF